jgi:hypothetical protein
MNEHDGTQRRKELFADFVRAVENPPPADCMALGHMMRDWLKAVVADPGTSVDTGGGFGCYDLWVKMGGKEVYIQIKEKA